MKGHTTADNSFPGWDRIQTSWLEALALYPLTKTPPDPPYWYGERASVGTLAGAVWRKGGVCLQEYFADKGGSVPGRGDLWFRLGDVTYTIESKQLWPRNADEGASLLQTSLDDADSQLAQHHASEEVENGVAVAFITPSVTEQLDDAAVQKFLDAVAHISETYAWWFPAEAGGARARGSGTGNGTFLV